MRTTQTTVRRKVDDHRRRAFTLIELLVVITLILILTSITVVSVNFSISADRMRAGARQLQSFLVGARDRAIYSKEIRGVRLLLDPNDTTNRTVNAVQYIGAPAKDSGSLYLDTTTTPSGYTVNQNPGTGLQWADLRRRGFLKIGSRIRIEKTWYTLAGWSNATTNSLQLNRKLDVSGSQIRYELELAPGLLNDSQPIQLPRGVVIDLDGSQVPSIWRPTTSTGSYSTQMDILFSPRGTIIGDAATLPMLHLHIADVGDVVKWTQIAGRNTALPFVPADDPASTTPTVTRDRILLTLASRTGNVSVHHVDATNVVAGATPTTPVNHRLRADDPYLYAETGEVANK